MGRTGKGIREESGWRTRWWEGHWRTQACGCASRADGLPGARGANGSAAAAHGNGANVALCALTGCTRGANGTAAAAHNDNDAVKCLGCTGLTGCTRGVCDTAAATHAASDVVYQIGGEWLTVKTSLFPPSYNGLKLKWLDAP